MSQKIKRNIYEEIAALYNLEIGEKFKIEDRKNIYMFSKNGIKCEDVYADSFILNRIIDGTFTIIKKPFTPKINEFYYSVNEEGCVEKYKWVEDIFDFATYNMGNCFRTEEIAEEMSDRMVKEMRKKYEENR